MACVLVAGLLVCLYVPDYLVCLVNQSALVVRVSGAIVTVSPGAWGCFRCLNTPHKSACGCCDLCGTCPPLAS